MKRNMESKRKRNLPYSFEQGPVRPPAEAESLLLRLTRNCPWNQCSFCPLYKNETFSIRALEHIIRDIETAYKTINAIKNACEESARLTQGVVDRMATSIPFVERPLFYAVLHWYSAGMKSIFFQDADSLIMKPADVIEILNLINRYFPEVERITSFARTHTLCNISDENLKTYAELGLNRIHSGLETGSDNILQLVKKGCTKEMQVAAGKKVKNAGIELSECVLLGIGGKNLTEAHAIETAGVINQINPPIIRFLTLVPPRGVELFSKTRPDAFIPATETDIAHEIKRFLENLDGITSYVESHNIVNLHQEVEGVMPGDREKMIGVLTTFLNLSDEERMVYQVGKRLGMFSRLSDVKDPGKFDIAKATCTQYGIHQDNVDMVIREVMQNYMS